MIYDLIVVGGGPSGMLGAATAAGRGLKVLLLEKNEKLGKKLYLTGKGRCNVTNYGTPDDFRNNIVANGKFLFSALATFDNHHLIELLESLGVPTKVERGNRVFPASDKSSDIIKALKKHLLTSGVEVCLGVAVQDLLANNSCIAGVIADNKKIYGKKVLLATGGMSYSQTGSTGDGYRMAKALGHTIVPLRPGLVPLETDDDWVKDLQGLTLKNVSVQALADNKIVAKQFGEMLFTHFGVSGPVILTLSSQIRHYFKESAPIQLGIDLKPALSLEQLEQRLQRDFLRHRGKQLKNSLGDLLPQKLITVLLALAKLDAHKAVDIINRQERECLAKTLKNIQLKVRGPRSLNSAIVTAGGINTKEINPSTMESKLIQGLYFAGEIIDVDALTGGYNLQIAFSTGYLCGFVI